MEKERKQSFAKNRVKCWCCVWMLETGEWRQSKTSGWRWGYFTSLHIASLTSHFSLELDSGGRHRSSGEETEKKNLWIFAYSSSRCYHHIIRFIFWRDPMLLLVVSSSHLAPYSCVDGGWTMVRWQVKMKTMWEQIVEWGVLDCRITGANECEIVVRRERKRLMK